MPPKMPSHDLQTSLYNFIVIRERNDSLPPTTEKNNKDLESTRFGDPIGTKLSI